MPRARRRSSGKAKKPIRPCTYEMGYVRQDLYACTKCTAEADGQPSGFCRGCRETCHADHLDAVFELYTKRDFRCDCGNARARNRCLLYPHKDDINVRNEKIYGHNFDGRYCRCDREYDFRLAMAQCAMCEDWFHEQCYTTDAAKRGGRMKPPLDMEYEFTCRDCVKTLPVLAEYYEHLNVWQSSRHAPLTTKSGREDVCTRPRTVDIALKPGAIDLLWRPAWRLQLCRCRECRALYQHSRAAYIIDRGDFIDAPPQDDLALLNATDDAEILQDLLEERDSPGSPDSPDSPDSREGDKEPPDVVMADIEPIPRKPLPGSVNMQGGTVSPEEVKSIRRRIQLFLEESIQSNGGSLNPESIRAYLCDLKADLLSSLQEPLRL